MCANRNDVSNLIALEVNWWVWYSPETEKNNTAVRKITREKRENVQHVISLGFGIFDMSIVILDLTTRGGY